MLPQVRALARGDDWNTLAGGRHPLTQLLRPSFTHPNANTLVLATASPAAKDTEHTLNTLRHACVMDGRTTEAEGQSWMAGGAVTKEEIGEIDMKATVSR
jgi:hypothetical protein